MTIRGKVRRGKGRGKALGFPTANIRLRISIPEGVYLAETRVNNRWYPSLAFIGAAKTFGEREYHAESYILDFNDDIYDQWISIRLIRKLRGNKTFTSSDKLVEQMRSDEEQARRFFAV